MQSNCVQGADRVTKLVFGLYVIYNDQVAIASCERLHSLSWPTQTYQLTLTLKFHIAHWLGFWRRIQYHDQHLQSSMQSLRHRCQQLCDVVTGCVSAPWRPVQSFKKYFRSCRGNFNFEKVIYVKNFLNWDLKTIIPVYSIQETLMMQTFHTYRNSCSGNLKGPVKFCTFVHLQ